MKLYGSMTSPFVRACRIAASELGLARELELAPTVVRPTEPNLEFGARVNPIRRVPALETATGEILIDSRVIIEFLNDRAGGAIIPADPQDRIAAFNRHAVAAGATEALVSAMYELRLRPEARRWPEWAADQVDKAQAACDWIERRIDDFAARFDIGAIGLVCLIGYAGFRFPGTDWLAGRPQLAAFMEGVRARPSVADTAPRE